LREPPAAGAIRERAPRGQAAPGCRHHRLAAAL
jgi:hypothetical protein